MVKPYEIRTISDLLKVPADRRAACLRAIEYSLEVYELTFGIETIGLEVLHWTDDENMSIQIQDEHGDDIVKLKVVGAEIVTAA